MLPSDHENIIPMTAYTEESIESLEKLAHIRLRPTGYITSTGLEGLLHITKEILDNVIDELEQIGIDIGKLTIVLCKDIPHGTYQIIICDNGRGVPVGSLMNSFTKLHTSGKFNTDSYKFSSGSFGIGAKATAGMSRYFRAFTNRPDRQASVYVEQGVPDNDIVISNYDTPGPHPTGTTVVFEPDPLIFTDIEQFAEIGYRELTLLLQKYCFFKKYNIEFLIHPIGLPKDIWKTSIQNALRLIRTYIAEAHPTFSEQTYDRIVWLRNYWNIHRPFAWENSISGQTSVEKTIVTRLNKSTVLRSLKYVVQMYYVKFEKDGGRFGMVNNVPIDEWKSHHLSTVFDVIKEKLTPYIKDSAIRKFFLESYKLPIFIAVDVKYEGAEFTGTTKHAFISKEFREAFAASLKSQLSNTVQNQYLTQLFELVYTDIEEKYNAQIGNIAKTKDLNRLFTELTFADKFADCLTEDRTKAELFIMEGGSASGKQGRDPEYQGLYALRGKPLNAITSIAKLSKTRKDLQEDEIYVDIIKILGINPSKFNLEDLNFHSVFICTDAD